MGQENSFITMMEKMSVLSKNSVELLAKLNDVVSSSDNTITVNVEEGDGSVSQYQLPSVGYLKNQIDVANANIKKLSGLDGDNSVVVTDTNSSKKIVSVDISREPRQIDSVNSVTSFVQSNNWFFEGLINPLLSVDIDLNGKVGENVNKVLSRRYIVEFERDFDGTLTANGQASLTDFQNKFLGKNNFTVNEFLKWLTNATNYGVLNRANPDYYMDEQVFDLNFKEVTYKGYYSVMKIETDTVNSKVWYHLNTLNYYSKDGSKNIIAVGDILALAREGKYSKYKVNEVNTSSSLFRLALERVEGYDPVPVGTNVLEYYADLKSQKTVNISIGFDEYDVIFVRPINTSNYVMGSTWSKGTAFYTNDLVLDTDSSVGLNDFYVKNVLDYGQVLEDMVKKRIPSNIGSKPNKPVFGADNFKVVQINKHLTDTKNLETLNKLHSQKNTSKAKLSQIQEAITEKNRELNTKTYSSVAEKNKAQNELNKLVSDRESESKLYASLVSQIVNSGTDSTVAPKYRVRGFWSIPDPIIKSGYKNQEVIGFEVQYRYSSKLNNDNKTEGFTVTENNVNVNGYYSNWQPYKTDVRKRSYNSSTGEWYWETEDISDADTPNINQLDIPIQADEKVEVKIRSISEVGYPETPLYSDWSDIATINFPEELKDALGNNDSIMKEATQEEMRVNFDNDLASRGIIDHVDESFYNNDKYVAHTDVTIATSFKDSNGNSLMLFDYLKLLNDKITALEESIKRAKGELKVTLFKGVNGTKIENNSKTNITIYADDYADVVSDFGSGKTFNNNVYLVQDYILEFQNVATENALGLLVSNNPVSTKNTLVPSYVDDVGEIKSLKNQKTYIKLNTLSFENDELYDGTSSMWYTSTTDDSVIPNDVLISSNKNLGGQVISNINNPDLWYFDLNKSPMPVGKVRTDTNGVVKNTSIFGATVHPVLDLVDISAVMTVKELNAGDIVRVPINVYFKMDVNQVNSSNITILRTDTVLKLSKKVRFEVNLENSEKPFSFQVNFNMLRHKQFN